MEMDHLKEGINLRGYAQKNPLHEYQKEGFLMFQRMIKTVKLDVLRKQANAIDGWESPFKVVVSVLMLKEGWDVQNVTTIVGLRSYSTDSKILPEQTLGRGLRRMYR